MAQNPAPKRPRPGEPTKKTAAAKRSNTTGLKRPHRVANEAPPLLTTVVDELRALVHQLRDQVAMQERQIQALITRQADQLTERRTSGPASTERIDLALQELRHRLPVQEHVVVEGSESVRRRWVDQGLVVGSAELRKAWGVSRQALDQAAERGDLVRMKIANRQYYPAGFLELASQDVAKVCRALQPLDEITSIVFWSRKHGALGNRTVTEALKDGKLAAVLQLAGAYAEELRPAVGADTSTAAGAHAA
ncbi:hypothetical protein [Caldimonas brevitalea]|nr:hypothetical protein [Caldimonas brevitalea]